MTMLTDSFGRTFRYLRLSITDRCNFRCEYCLPNGYQAPAEKIAELSADEIYRLCAGFNLLNFAKVRITGGEPTLRRDLVDIVQAISSHSNIHTLALTTNGHNLERLARPLYNAGLRQLNVSVDSLNPEHFKAITGVGKLDGVLRGIESALECGFKSVKVNAVLLRGISDQEFSSFFEWIRHRPISVRFIELMRTGKNVELFEKKYISAGEVQLELLKRGWTALERSALSGPAVEYQHANFAGKIGLIAPYAENFCDNCNRLRVSCRGDLRLCLFGEEDFSLRPLLYTADYAENIANEVRRIILRKPESHYLKEGKYGNTWNLASIGG